MALNSRLAVAVAYAIRLRSSLPSFDGNKNGSENGAVAMKNTRMNQAAAWQTDNFFRHPHLGQVSALQAIAWLQAWQVAIGLGLGFAWCADSGLGCPHVGQAAASAETLWLHSGHCMRDMAGSPWLLTVPFGPVNRQLKLVIRPISQAPCRAVKQAARYLRANFKAVQAQV